MNSILNLNIEEMIGIPADVIVLGLAALVIILIIIQIINGIKMSQLKNRYNTFMAGRSGKSLESILTKGLTQIDDVLATESQRSEKMQQILDHYDNTYQKMGLVKYNAFNEMGGKLSFSLCLLNRKNNGFIINAMHSREGCFTYIKEVIDGNAVLMLADEEKEALEMAIKGE